MILLINKNRIRDFYFDPKSYKGIKIGDLIGIPVEHAEYAELWSSIVEVTGFNIEHDIVHWTSPMKYFNGKVHSGTKYEQVFLWKKRS